MNRRLSREEALAALAGERFNVANLRVQVRLTEDQLKSLGDFERRWDRFVQLLGVVVENCKQRHLSFWGPKLADGVRNAEDARLDLASRYSTVFNEQRDPLAKFMRTSLRTFSHDLWHLIGDVWTDEKGKVHVPIDGDGDPLYEASVEQFEIMTEQAKAETARQRHELENQLQWRKTLLEEAEHAVADEHRRELEKLQTTSLTKAFWQRLKQSRVGKVIWWFVEEPLRNLLWAGVLAIVTIPPLRDAALAVLRWIASVFS